MKVLNVRHTAEQPWKLDLEFSAHTHGLFKAQAYLANHRGPLLVPLRDPAYFKRAFVDAGAVCWTNGLELSPARLKELAQSGMDGLGMHKARPDPGDFGSVGSPGGH